MTSVDALGRDGALRSLATGALGFLAIGITASQQGAYFAPAWGWSALGFLLVVAAALVFRGTLEIAPLRLIFLAALTVVVVWTALSLVWSASIPRTVAEIERSLVYVAAMAALFALAPSADRLHLLVGVLASIVVISAHALVLRALGAVGAESLSGSLGYWNALGIVDAIGILLAVGLTPRASPRIIRAGAVASLPVLAITLFFTQSRGAAVALVLGLLVYFALDPRVRRVALVAAIAAFIAATATSAVWPGGPGDLMSRAYAAFSAPVGKNGQAEDSPFTLSGNERAAYWRVAWDEYRAHPWLGSGAGTFAIFWQRDRDTIYGAQDAHSLYLETLAELGSSGLLLVGAALVTPLLALWRARPDALERAAAAAYIAFLIHAGLDWDWEMPAITLAGLLCGGALLLGVPGRRRPISSALRASGLTVVTAVAAFVTISYAGNAAMEGSLQAAALGDLERSDGQARTAGRWNPWSSDALRIQGEIAQARGHADDAASSFRAAIAIDGNDWRLWYDLALVTNGDEHARALDEAERLNPLSPEVRALRDR